jgi:hypothetical protein
MEIPTIIDIKTVKVTKRGRAYFLKKSVQQAITIEMAKRATDKTRTIAVLTKISLNVMLL